MVHTKLMKLVHRRRNNAIVVVVVAIYTSFWLKTNENSGAIPVVDASIVLMREILSYKLDGTPPDDHMGKSKQLCVCARIQNRE